MLANSTVNIGYNFFIKQCDGDGNITTTYFDPDTDSVIINILNNAKTKLRTLDISSFTQIGEVVGKNYNIKFIPQLYDTYIEIVYTKDSDLYRDLLKISVNNSGETITECENNNFFFRS